MAGVGPGPEGLQVGLSVPLSVWARVSRSRLPGEEERGWGGRRGPGAAHGAAAVGLRERAAGRGTPERASVLSGAHGGPEGGREGGRQAGRLTGQVWRPEQSWLFSYR